MGGAAQLAPAGLHAVPSLGSLGDAEEGAGALGVSEDLGGELPAESEARQLQDAVLRAQSTGVLAPEGVCSLELDAGFARALVELRAWMAAQRGITSELTRLVLVRPAASRAASRAACATHNPPLTHRSALGSATLRRGWMVCPRWTPSGCGAWRESCATL